MRLRGSSRDGARTAALRDFDPAYDRFGSIASDRHPRDAGAMSAFTPIASKLWKRSETTRCASSGHAFALGDDWIVPSADYRAAVLDLPPRMA